MTAGSPPCAPPLALATFHGHARTVRLLAQSGADPEIPDMDGNRPVHLLVLSGADAATMKVLLEHGADPNSVGGGDLRPLTGALMARRNDLALALLEADADPNQAARDWTPLRAAFRTRNDEMVDELYRREAKQADQLPLPGVFLRRTKRVGRGRMATCVGRTACW